MKTLLALFLILTPSCLLAADGLDDLSNYRRYSDTFASSGQPTTDHLKILEEQGVKRIIYLAFTDNDTAINAEDRKVMELDMEYLHIPVDFMNPTLQDFKYFSAAMQAAPDTNTLLHCQINLRASSFSFLYRIIVKKVPVADALDDLQSVWAPNEVWFNFIQTVSEHYGVDILCDECDWGGSEFN
ncbi:MAG: hypothetical protein HOC70_04650 [Gammaproteobacteria bacterium]|jgi:protein tyrosine phosphatase (PTP) superfamily phosphohydrolase (DUF442 family)|nr:hypothetical protein [Gammaproteobacteria bacterium]MBT7369873.1 hypothetical protein [Gammaproteobacteria bacterium]